MNRPTKALAALCCALMVLAGLTALTAAPAYAANKVRLSAPATAEVGSRVQLHAKVRPAAKGRKIVFQRKTPSGWAALGTKRTNGRGVAKLKVRFADPGTARVRAVAKAHRGMAQRTGGTKVAVEPRKPPSDETDHLSVAAPPMVETGQRFEIILRVGDETVPLRRARLTVSARGGGVQVTPPDDILLGALGTGTLTLGDRPAGPPRTVPLHWRAPASPGTVTFVAELDAEGVREMVESTVHVAPAASGGGLFGDTLASMSDATEAPTHPEQLFERCFFVDVPSGPVPTFAAALAQAKAWLADTIDPQHAPAWQQLPGQHDARLLDEVMWMAVADRRPAAVLAAALRSHELQPGNATHLANAAAAANMLDRPQWAIAFAEEAGRAGPGPSVGVRQEAVRLVNLAHAWASTGDWGRAVSILRLAVANDPDSQQAHRQLATALYCSGLPQAALPHLRRSLRPDDRPDPVTYGEGEGATTLRDSGDLFDLSAGVTQSLAFPRVASSWEEFAGMAENGYYRRQHARLMDRLSFVGDRIWQLQMQWEADDIDPVTRRRTEDLLQRVGEHADRVVIDAWDAYQGVVAGTIGPLYCHDDTRHPYCIADGDLVDYSCDHTASLVERYKTSMETRLSALGAMHATVAPRLSGIQAQLSDPRTHEMAGLLAEHLFLADLSDILSNLAESAPTFAYFNAFHEGTPDGDPPCRGTAPPAEEPEVETERVPAPPCGRGDHTPLDIAVDVEVATLFANCEKVGFEGSAKITPWASAFGRYTHRNTNGNVTVNVGLMYGGGGAGFESSFYLTQDRNGKVVDFGWQIGPEMSVGKRVTLNTYEDKVQISLMNVFSRD